MRSVVIRGTMLGGYPFVLAPILLFIITPISIKLYPADSVRWLVTAGILLIINLASLAVVRRTFVRVDGERIRWSFRRPPSRGDEPVTNLRSVTIYPMSGALLEFAGGAGRLMLGIDDFRTRDILKVVAALRALGARIDDSRGPMEGLLNILLGRASSHH